MGNDGSIDLTVSGGTAPYSYLCNMGDIMKDPSNMPAGIYGGKIFTVCKNLSRITYNMRSTICSLLIIIYFCFKENYPI